jgi:uncharacterized NAD(P)/FAD-binding protein YdhS
VAIVGAGFAGTLQAINLMRHQGPRATLIEARHQPARGVAYSAAHPDHLLNVRAAKMSALPDDEGHFVRWLAARGVDAGPATFVPRLTYGDYLTDLFRDSQERNGDRLRLVASRAIDIGFADGRPILHLDDGSSVAADAVVLALGNLPPHDPPALAEADLPAPLYARDPWGSDIVAGLGDDDQVLLVGTGLTMIDAALLFEAAGFRGRILAMSRRGLRPRTHVDGVPPSSLAERPPVATVALLRAVRRRAGEVGWHAAVDELRPYTQSLWRAASEMEQSRFLRHLRPWWDVHRHRIAPAVAAKIDAMRAAGRLKIGGGKLVRVEREGDSAKIVWRRRGSSETERLRAARIVNCTGPQGDLLRTDEPLLRRLIERGLIRPDSHRLGIDVTTQAEVIGSDGQASPNLFALGPMTRGCFWEIVAVPDIRGQTWSLARYLSNAHWVGGEGL